MYSKVFAILTQFGFVSFFGLTRVGNFIIGASGSDKQMLCASSGARAAPIIAVKYWQ